jgi:hypothetical protein
VTFWDWADKHWLLMSFTLTAVTIGAVLRLINFRFSVKL